MRSIYLFALLTAWTCGVRANEVRQVLETSGIRGGLIVHIECGDGEVTAALRANDSCVVHGLSREAQDIETARRDPRVAGSGRLEGRQGLEGSSANGGWLSQKRTAVQSIGHLDQQRCGQGSRRRTGQCWRKTTRRSGRTNRQ